MRTATDCCTACIVEAKCSCIYQPPTLRADLPAHPHAPSRKVSYSSFQRMVHGRTAASRLRKRSEVGLTLPYRGFTFFVGVKIVSPRAAADGDLEKITDQEHISPTCCCAMPPAAEVDLELRRLGSVGGVLGLLRRRSVDESAHVYAGRIQLGAALLASKLDITPAHTKCGATTSAGGDAGGDEEGSAVVASWGGRALAAVLDAIVQGGRCFWPPTVTSRQQTRPHIWVVCISAGMYVVAVYCCPR